MKYVKVEEVWKDQSGLLTVNFYPDKNKLYLEVGDKFGAFYFKINISEFWSVLCDYMEHKNSPAKSGDSK